MISISDLLRELDDASNEYTSDNDTGYLFMPSERNSIIIPGLQKGQDASLQLTWNELQISKFLELKEISTPS